MSDSVAGVERRVRLLTFTNLYPNGAQPAHGLFVETRLLRLVSQGVEAVVIAPIPWAPGAYTRYRNVPRVEDRGGLRIHHPRFLTVPGLGRFMAPFSMMLAALPVVRKLLRDEGVDIVDAHYFYPDGVAAAFLAKVFGIPLVITARGTDVNLLPDYFVSRVLIKWAAGVADRVIAVSEALRARLIALGVQANKVVALRNGVDTALFAPRDRVGARRRLELPEELILLSVGNLIESKGHHLVIEALLQIPEARLVIVGEGPLREWLGVVASNLSVADRVSFAGVVDQDRLIDYYNAADVLVLATLREGMPNVVLEAVSCGLPVVATDCGGIAEIIDTSEMGSLMPERTAGAVVASVLELLRRAPSRSATRAAALRLGWNPTIEEQSNLYRAMVSGAS